MDKKTIYKKILEKIQEERPLAKVMLILSNNDELEDEFIDVLIDFFRGIIGKIDDKKMKDKIEKTVKFMEKLKNEEIRSNENNEKRLKELDTLIENI